MKKLVPVIVWVCYLAGISNAQLAWHWLMPKPQGNDLFDLQIQNQSTAIAVGASGTVIKTDNGGTTWQVQHNVAGISTTLTAVFFIDSQTGWAVGEKGQVLKTIDGGNNWDILASGTSLDLYDVHFSDHQHGWIVGRFGKILKTENGGDLWRPVTSGTLRLLASVYFRDNATGWAVGHGGTIIHSTDGGSSWQAQPSVTANHLLSLFFIDQQTGWAAGENGTILKTNNGGIDWEVQNNPEEGNLKSLFFVNADSGWAAGCLVSEYDGATVETQGILLKTINGGASWTLGEIDPVLPLNAISFTDTNDGWAVGAGGSLVQFVNFDTDIKSTNKVLDAYPFSTYFLDETTGWVTGANSVSRTTDGGNTWNTVYLNSMNNPVTTAPYYQLLDVQFTDPHTGWITGYSVENEYSTPRGIIFKSTDGGTTWISQRDQEAEVLISIFFLNSTTGWAAGSDGGILKTTDGGARWQRQPRIASVFLYSVCFVDSNKGWISGARGTLLKTENGGQRWRSKRSDTSNDLFSMHFVDENHGWAVGFLGTVIKTSDGGETWERKRQVTTNMLWSVFFLDSLNGAMVGDDGLIFLSHDGGDNWHLQPGGTTIDLTSIFLVNQDIGYIVGTGGTILKTNQGGFTFVKAPDLQQSMQPNKIFLCQNYPNPFNTTTTIRFHVPEPGPVTLQVYNVLGELVHTLVDDYRYAGTHEIKLNGNNLATGLYFFRLQAGTLEESRRFILQK